MSKTARIGILGAGGIANEHLEQIIECKCFVPYAICDNNTAAMQETGTRFGILNGLQFNDYNELLQCVHVDAVIIATPNFMHYPMAMAAIQAKKPFALEKPVALTLEDAKEIYEAATAANIPNMVCFSYRFYPALRYAKMIVDSGELGEIHHVYGQYIQGIDTHTPRLWRYEKSKAGAGTLGDIGSHLIDMARFVAGEFSEVVAQDGIIVNERPAPNGEGLLPVDVDDYIHFIARMENGATGTFASTKFAFGRKNAQRLEVYGSKGAVVYDQEKGINKLYVCIGKTYGRTGEFVPVDIPGEFQVKQIEAFQSIISGKDRKLAASVEDGYRVQMMIDSLIRSAQERRWIKI
jgi:predicted dehydrogenase